MECNRDEATRAKEIAEKKFSAKDIAGAKKFAVKAQNLFPGLEGISQMLATFDVYIAAENKISGESDWYEILGVDPLADDDTVRKHYRKLALTLHPDKNKSIGADGAFKLISEAWSSLSDKTRRLAYDQKRNVKGSTQKVQTQTGGSSTPSPGANGFYNFTKNTVPRAKGSKVNANSSKAGPSSVPGSSNKQKNTFWTVCHRCKMQYEYLRMYLYQNLLCPNCNEPFLALETPAPVTNGSKARHSYHQGGNKNVHCPGGSNSKSPNEGSYNHTNVQWGPFSKTTNAASSAKAATMVQKAYEKVKREREEAQAAIKREEALRRKKQSSNSVKKRRGMENANRHTMNQKGMGTGVVNSASISGVNQVKVSAINKAGSLSGVSDVENCLMEKARMEIRKKLNEWSSATVANSTVVREENANEKPKDKEKEIDNAMVNGVKQDENMFMRSSSGGDLNNESVGPYAIDVPDPDFHDFDRERTEKSFAKNQVWAAYDDDDGMPRYYAMIHDVISVDPFKIKISWLSSKSNNGLSQLNWVGSGFSKTSGDFRLGRHEINVSLNSFSHKVKWIKGTHGIVKMYPQRGDVWALYRNWSQEWNELTSDEEIHQYDIVEVEDCEEQAGASVIPLVKVAGFKTVFHRHLDPRKVKIIPSDEMFRFSHQIPSYLLTGQEAPKAPKGCWELDPAATPSEFHQVIADVKDSEITESEEKEKCNAENIVGSQLISSLDV